MSIRQRLIDAFANEELSQHVKDKVVDAAGAVPSEPFRFPSSVPDSDADQEAFDRRKFSILKEQTAKMRLQSVAYLADGRGDRLVWVGSELLRMARAYEASLSVLHHSSHPVTGTTRHNAFFASLWLADLLLAYECVSGELDAAAAKLIGERLFKAAAREIVEHFPGECWNGHCWADLAVGWTGFLFNEPNMVEWALHGSHGFWHHVAHEILSDGRWWEDSVLYSFFAVEPLLLLAAVAFAWNYPDDLLYGKVGADTNPEYHYTRDPGLKDAHISLAPPPAGGEGERSLSHFLDAFLQTAFPDGSTYEVDSIFRFSTVWGIASGLSSDPAYRWAWDRCEQGPIEQALHLALRTGNVNRGLGSWNTLNRAAAPNVTSRHFPHFRQVALRSDPSPTYWGGEGTVVVVQYGENRIKSKTKRLDLSIFGRGRVLFPMSSMGSSGQHWVPMLGPGTLVNGLTVDGKLPRADWSGEGQVGECLLYEDGAACKAAQLHCRGWFDGVAITRTVALVGADIIVDVLWAESAEPRMFAWHAHSPGRLREVQAFGKSLRGTAAEWDIDGVRVWNCVWALPTRGALDDARTLSAIEVGEQRQLTVEARGTTACFLAYYQIGPSSKQRWGIAPPRATADNEFEFTVPHHAMDAFQFAVGEAGVGLKATLLGSRHPRAASPYTD